MSNVAETSRLAYYSLDNQALLESVRGQGIIFRETGVRWVQVDSGRCQAMGPGYVFQWWPGRFEINTRQINWILEKIPSE